MDICFSIVKNPKLAFAFIATLMMYSVVSVFYVGFTENFSIDDVR